MRLLRIAIFGLLAVWLSVTGTAYAQTPVSVDIATISMTSGMPRLVTDTVCVNDGSDLVCDRGVYITSANRVGIGTATPQASYGILDVRMGGSTPASYTSIGAFVADYGSSQHSRLLIGQVTSNSMFLEVADQSNTKGTLRLQPYGGRVMVGNASTLTASLTVAGGEIQTASGGVSCSSAMNGAIRFSGGDFSFCRNGSAWETLSSLGGSGQGDRITSGTVAALVNSTGYISLSTASSTWGYFGSADSYLPRLTTAQVSATTISTTAVQIFSPSTALACSSSTAGTIRYNSPTTTLELCTGSGWQPMGVGVPAGTISAFASTTCPTGWSEYTAARGRFLRGIDNGAGNDPDGTRAPGATQADMFKNHTHNFPGGAAAIGTGTIAPGGQVNLSYTFDMASYMTGGTGGGAETRPKNVAVIYCQFNGTSNGWNNPLSGGSTVAAGSTGQVQYNTSNAFDASPNFTWTNASSRLTATNVSATSLTVGGQTLQQIIASNSVAGITRLASLTDVSLSNVTGMDILRFNGTSWTNVNVQNAISTTTMVAGWPDAIRCTTTSVGPRIFYISGTPNAVSGQYTYIDPVYDAVDTFISFTSGGSYASQGAALDTSGTCYNKTIAQLYAEGRAFNFIGGSGTVTPSVDRITSGTTSVVANQNTSVSIYTANVERVVVGADGRVGIGQQPVNNAMLGVAGDIRVGNTSRYIISGVGGLQESALISGGLALQNASNGIMFETGGTPAERVRITSTGNVGIGSTAPAAPLEISSSATANGMVRMNAPAGSYRHTRYLSGNVVRWDVGVDSTAEGGSNAGSHFFINRFSDAGAYLNTPFVIHRDTGNIGMFAKVGVGVLNPSTTLHTNGTIRMGSAGEACDADRTGAVRYTGGDFSFCRNGSAWETLTSLGGSGQGDRITSGTTSVVANSSTSTISFSVAGVNTGYMDGSGRLIVPGISVTTNQSSFTSGYFSGNVGIGVTAPAAKLEVRDTLNGTVAAQIYNTSTGASAQTRLNVSSGSPNAYLSLFSTENSGTPYGMLTFATGHTAGYISTEASSPLIFRTSATERVRITGSGGVGIGTTGPIVPLDVAGSVRSTGNLISNMGGGEGGQLVLGYAGVTNLVGQSSSGTWNLDVYTDNSLRLFRSSPSGTLVVLSVSESTGNVGVKDANPTAALDVGGTLKFADGGEACDANRVGAIRYTASDFSFCRNGTTWETMASIAAGDNLGNHTATTTLNMGANEVTFGSTVGDKVNWYSNTYGTGIETNTLTNWAAVQFRWRIGGTSVSSGTERMLLTNTALNVNGLVSATGFYGAADSAAAPDYTWFGNTNTGMYRAAANIIGFSTNGSEAMRINASNQVGIGGVATPGAALDVSASTNQLRLSGTGGAYALFSAYDGSGGGIDPQLDINPLGGDATTSYNIRMFRSVSTTGATGLMVMGANGTASVNSFIGSNANSYLNVLAGSVGIGTSAPYAKLDVSGTVIIADGGEACDANRVGAIRYTASDFSFCRNGTTWETMTSIAAGDNLGNHTATTTLDMGNNRIGFGTGGTGDKVTWYSNTYGTGIESGTLSNWAASQFRWRIGGTSVSTGTERMLLTNTALNVNGLVSATGFYGAADSAAAPDYTWFGNTNTGMFRAAANTIGFSTNGTEAMRLTASNQLGLGTTAPSTSLHTAGTLRLASGGEACDANRTGGIRYTGGDFSFCRNGTTWETLTSVVGNLSNYVAKAGDTMTGSLLVQPAGMGQVGLVGGNASNPGYIQFTTSDSVRRGYIGWNNGSSRLLIASENGWNYSFSQAPLVGTNVMWHAGNDGSGSGLDADTLDGIDSGSFLRSGQTYTGDNVITIRGSVPSDDVWSGGLELQEVNGVANTQTGSTYAPALTFHWNAVAAAAIKMYSDGSIRIRNQSTNATGYQNFYAQDIYASRNDGTGLVMLGSGSRYLYYDGTNYQMPGANLYVSGSLVATNGSDPSFGLVAASNWFRSSGNTGWMNSTYSGGWFMSDTTWVRSYNNKSVYTSGNIRADGQLQTNNLCDTAGANCSTPAAIAAAASASANKVSKSGDTMSGDLIVNARVGIGASNPQFPLDVSATSSYAIRAITSGNAHGITGQSLNAGQGGVIGMSANGAMYGILGHANQYSLYGIGPAYVRSTNSTAAVSGQNTSNGVGVYGTAASNYGVTGTSTNSYGVYGQTSSAGSGGVIGYAANGSTYGILGYANTYSIYGNGSGYLQGSFQADGNIFTGAGYFRSNMPGIYGAGSYVCFTGTGIFDGCGSLRKFKKDIRPIDMGLATVMQLEPVAYTWKSDGEKDFGFVAEDVVKIDPRLGSKGTSGTLSGVRYEHMSAILTKAIQEQQGQIVKLNTENNNLRATVDQQKAANDNLSRSVEALTRRLERLEAQQGSR